MIDLKKNKYTMDVLIKNIYQVNLWDIIQTQVINEFFTVKYILNPKYQLSESEKCINVDMVMYYQPHLKKEKLFFYLKTICLDEEEEGDIKFDEYIN